MEECELCGARTKDVYIVDIESVELRVCTKCAVGKKIVSKVVEKTNAPKQSYKSSPKSEEPLLIENYGTVMHNAREAMKIPIKVLAEMISEKETHLSRVEQQKTLPSEELRKKIEKALSIKLTEPATTHSENKSYGGGGDKPTLGDFIKKK